MNKKQELEALKEISMDTLRGLYRAISDASGRGVFDDNATEKTRWVGVQNLVQRAYEQAALSNK
jgi:hypothetical protein